VVEFAPDQTRNFTSAQLLNANLQRYLQIMIDAPATLDILVFPEMTLNSMLQAVEIPEAAEKIVPCDNSTFAEGNLVKLISCSAKSYQRYIVANFITKVQCPDPEMIANGDTRNCSRRADGFSYYNTNVVFDRKGEVIARYRKFNLFGEAVDRPAKPALVTFDTDFGVRFGTFICFDLTFRRPAIELVRNATATGVTDIIYPTMWYSELPFLTAVQVQQNWAHSFNVNLLASGANNPGVGSTGTGIFASRYGSLASVMQGSSETKLYTATVPKKYNESIHYEHKATKFSANEMQPLYLLRDELDNYTISFSE